MSDQHDQHMASLFNAQDVSVVTPEAFKCMLAHRTQQTAQQDRRLVDIFGQAQVPKVTEATLAIYLDYLTQHLEVPCQLTGIESRGCFAGSALHVMLFLETLIRGSLIFNGLRSPHCQ